MKNVIISNYSKDIFINENKVKKGGPAKFIVDVFKKNNILFDLITSENEAKVEIINVNGEDKGKVIDFSEIKIENFDINCNLIVSTLSNEINLNSIPRVKGISAIDIQGFVRDNSDYRKKKFFNLDNLNFDILKGTK